MNFCLQFKNVKRLQQPTHFGSKTGRGLIKLGKLRWEQ